MTISDTAAIRALINRPNAKNVPQVIPAPNNNNASAAAITAILIAYLHRKKLPIRIETPGYHIEAPDAAGIKAAEETLQRLANATPSVTATLTSWLLLYRDCDVPQIRDVCPITTPSEWRQVLGNRVGSVTTCKPNPRQLQLIRPHPNLRSRGGGM